MPHRHGAFLTWAIGRGEYSVSCSDHFIPEERPWYPVIAYLDAMIRTKSLTLQEIKSKSCIQQSFILLIELSQLTNNSI
jgi:hypothetical protein